jgi:nicotinamide-nucleotide amidase
LRCAHFKPNPPAAHLLNEAIFMLSLFRDDIDALARQIVEKARAMGVRFALAESCTGGLLCGALTEVPGASEVIEGSFVTYSNAMKHEILGVSEDVIDTFGAVSEAVAWAMARGAQQRSGSDFAVAITGIAGPGGGSERKPVGLVVFALAQKGAHPDHYVAESRLFGDLGRTEIRLQAVRVALELLLAALGEEALP